MYEFNLLIATWTSVWTKPNSLWKCQWLRTEFEEITPVISEMQTCKNLPSFYFFAHLQKTTIKIEREIWLP